MVATRQLEIIAALCESVCLCPVMWKRADGGQLASIKASSPLSDSRLLVFVFQSESEHDEESTGSMGSASVAVSPLQFLYTLLIFTEEFQKSRT